jgi:UDP-N-acetyl-D-mannosaminuronic acid dehydrogenase
MEANSKFFKIQKNVKVQKLVEKLESLKKNEIANSVAIKFNKYKEIEGVVSLGDLRRLIFNNKHDDRIFQHLNRKPYYLPKVKNIKNIQFYEKKLKFIIEKNYDDILIIDENKKLLDIVDSSDLENNINFKSICIVGLGHIGLPLLTHMLRKVDFITGYDFNQKSIKKIKKINLNFFETGLNSLLKYNLNKGNIRLTNNFEKVTSNVYIICLGSELIGKKINNKNIISVLKKIAKKIYKNNLILIRGTVQVGFTNSIAKKLIEKESGLKCGKDFFLGYMPERIIEGNAINELENLPQIISGATKTCLNKSINFCNNFFSKIIETSSTEESEIIKLTSNSYRDLNFSFANEISRISSLYNLSGHEIVKKANLGYERNSIARPSLGVGGFCLPKDVLMFNQMAKKSQKGYKLLISRKINEESINRISLQIINLFKKNFKKHSTVLILGVAFKGTPETIDIRNSPSIILSKKLSNNKINNFLYDVKGRDIAKNNKQIKNFLFDSKKIKNFDLIIIANNNPKYGNLIVDNLPKIKSKNKSKLIYDCWNTLDKEVCKSSGYEYYTI